MIAGLLGKKIGMTQIFTENGNFVPVTVIEAGPCTVLGIQSDRIRLGFGSKKEKNTPNPQKAFYKKLNVSPKAFVKELRFVSEDKLSVGQEITVDIFKENDFVDITGTSKGKGFQGGVKRWHWAGGPDGHGSMHHRRVGSVGASSFPSKVNKGQRLPGRMGNEKKTVQSLKVVKIISDKNLLLVKGVVPGASNGFVEIKTAKKRPCVRTAEQAKKSQEKINDTSKK